MRKNEEIAEKLYEIERILRIKGTSYKPRAYHTAAETLEDMEKDVEEVYKEEGVKGLEELPGIGESIAFKIEEYLKKGKIDYLDEIKEETAIRQIVTHYFKTKGVSLGELKRDAKKRKIVYSRYTRPAKQLLELAGSLEKAKKAIDIVAKWAKSRNLDYAIETVFKKWLELDRLKPKEIVKKPYYKGDPMVWSKSHRKWYVISPNGEWLEFAGREKDIEWRIER